MSVREKYKKNTEEYINACAIELWLNATNREKHSDVLVDQVCYRNIEQTDEETGEKEEYVALEFHQSMLLTKEEFEALLADAKWRVKF